VRDLGEADWIVLDTVDRYLSDALLLKQWFERVDPDRRYARCFELERTFNRPDTSYGFFDEVELSAGRVPVMGSVQDMLYDRPRAPAGSSHDAADWMNRQIREFALKYFMRVSSFRQPQAAVQEPRRSYAGPFSWCPGSDVPRQGFGFAQLYYKRRDTGEIGRFAEDEQYAMTDLREIGPTYEWIVGKVRIFDLEFRFRPFGGDGPQIVVALDAESYLVLTRDFIVDESSRPDGALGRYGTGYAFVRMPEPSTFAYGPGRFQAAFELIEFRVRGNGVVDVHMVFVANRPDRIANVAIRPIDWTFRLADLATFGISSRLFGGVRDELENLPLRLGTFDPVRTYISLANALTAGQAATELCISHEQLDQLLLVQHFMEHYQTVLGSLLTWRQIPDWLDAAALPDWVVRGRSS